MKNYYAQALGRMGKGIKKTLSPEQRAAQAERVARAREKLAQMRRRKEV